MIKKALFVIMINVPGILAACSCVSPKSFCITTQEFLLHNPQEVLIVRAIIQNERRPQPNFPILEMSINESFHNPYDLEELEISAYTTCARSLEGYEIGDQLIFILYGDRKEFSICYPEPLRVKNNFVHGLITDEDSKMSLNAFRDLFNKTCDPFEFELSPNPANEFVDLEITQGPQTVRDFRVELFQLTGVDVWSGQVTPTERSVRIPIQNYPSGVYYLRIRYAGKSESVPLVICR